MRDLPADVFAIVIPVGAQEAALRHDGPRGRAPMLAASLESLAAFYGSADRICRARGWRWRVAHFRLSDRGYVRLPAKAPVGLAV